MKAPQTGPTRKAIILLSDGEDNQSRVTREEAIEMAQRAEVILYTISTNVSGVKMRGDKVLERMAEATGGRAFFPSAYKTLPTRSRRFRTNCAASMCSPTSPQTSPPMAISAASTSSPRIARDYRCARAKDTSRRNRSFSIVYGVTLACQTTSRTHRPPAR